MPSANHPPRLGLAPRKREVRQNWFQFIFGFLIGFRSSLKLVSVYFRFLNRFQKFTKISFSFDTNVVAELIKPSDRSLGDQAFESRVEVNAR